jgi:hypothetical protein
MRLEPVSDRLVLAVISATKYELPRDISARLGRRRINGSLGRLIRVGLLERVPGPTCFLYRSKQTRIA